MLCNVLEYMLGMILIWYHTNVNLNIWNKYRLLDIFVFVLTKSIYHCRSNDYILRASLKSIRGV